MDAARSIAEAVLYEGYILWPYRRSAIKNRQRWTFGGVYPRAYSETHGGADPWLMQTQCLITGNENTTVEARVRFLHVTERKIGAKRGEALEFVEELRVGRELYLPWEEATEREIALGPFAVGELESPMHSAIDIPGGSSEETLTGDEEEPAGAIVRCWRALCGTVEMEAEPLGGGVYRVTVAITNTTPWTGENREGAPGHTLTASKSLL